MQTTRGSAVRLLAATLAALILAATAGCGDEQEGAPPPETTTEADLPQDTGAVAGDDSAVYDTDPCGLLTGSDVKAILGVSAKGELVAERDPASQTAAQCQWQPSGKVDLTKPDAVQGILVAVAGEPWYSGIMSLTEEDESFEELELGDESFAGNTSGGFLIGPGAVTVQLTTGAAPASHPKVVDALERLHANYEG